MSNQYYEFYYYSYVQSDHTTLFPGAYDMRTTLSLHLGGWYKHHDT